MAHTKSFFHKVKPTRKPPALTELEDFLLDISSQFSISLAKACKARGLLNKIEFISQCVTQEFYSLVKSTLVLLEAVYSNRCVDMSELFDKLARIRKILLKEDAGDESLESLKTGLAESLDMITAKNLSVLSRCLMNYNEVATVVKGYLYIMKDIDNSVEISSDPASDMFRFVAIPGKAVQTTRSIFGYIHHKIICEDTIRNTNKLISEVRLDTLKIIDLSGISLILYKFVAYVLEYYMKYHKLDVRKQTPKRLRSKKRLKSNLCSYKSCQSDFSEFLKEKLIERKGDVDVIQRDRFRLLGEYESRRSVSRENLERLSKKRAYSECIDSAVKRLRRQIKNKLR